MSAPVRYTCPDVDRAIKHIEQARTELYDINTDDDITREIIDDTRRMLRGLVDEFEGLRTSNSKLRDWGEDLEDQLGTAAQTISELEDQVAELETEKQQLKNCIDELENQ